ncbi:major facilitator superfamily domain-containing protein [Cokeromyces recurvatus]|uniref:major facilitator superfamily domain-containing protein n=1 Tax=Cokeromyces recurvatus TaxID=90255 RepID=UPI00221F3FAA|nr:major facilitator superfamily domain-containing protein [Cokeromyces recurvatus]KAI7903195.1 major facilitator superfamily domain-containing protein [Cokeromyces recurvatus]
MKLSSVTPIVHKSSFQDDSHENILDIIKLYNDRQDATTTTIIKEPITNKQLHLLNYRSSNFYVIVTAALGIISNIYMNVTISFIVPYLIESKGILSSFNIYILSGFYFLGHLSSLILFGWLCNHESAEQRKMSLLFSSLASIVIVGVLIIAFNEHWILFPINFLQGLSNGAIWLTCSISIADRWSLHKLGSMVGLIGGLYSLGMALGLTVGALYQYIGFKASLISSLIVSSLTFFMQLMITERPSATETPDSGSLRHKEETHHFKEDTEKGDSCCSHMSSMSTINLWDPSMISEEEMNSKNMKKQLSNSVIFKSFISKDFATLMCQMILISIVLGALKVTLLEKLTYQMYVINPIYQNIIMSTFLLPFSVSCFIHGWLCDRFGSKLVSLISLIISIPSFVWVGIPNQNIQSVVAALTVSGMTTAGIWVSIIFCIIQFAQQPHPISLLLLIKEEESNVKLTTVHQRQYRIIVLCFISMVFEIGSFVGASFLSRLNELIGFFWLCFLFAGLFLLCILLMIYLFKSKDSINKELTMNTTRPESLPVEPTHISNKRDEFMLLTSSFQPMQDVSSSKLKPIIVVP